VNLGVGDKVLVKVDGEDGIVGQNSLNLVGRKNGSVTQDFGAIIIAFGEWFEVTCTAEIDTLTAERGSASGSGDLKFSVMPERTLYDYFSNEITRVEERAFGKYVIDAFDLSDAINGYFYNASGVLTSNADSSYKNFTITSAEANKKIVIKVERRVTAFDGRYYLLYDGDGNLLYSIYNGQIAGLPGRQVEIPVVLKEGFVLKCSWSKSYALPSIGPVEVYVPSIADELMVYINRLLGEVDGSEVTEEITTYGNSTGYYYDASGATVSNADSSYKEISLDADVVGKNITIEVNDTTGASDSRCYAIKRNGSVVASITNGEIKRLHDGKYTFQTKVESSDIFLCSWRTLAGRPSIYYVVSSTPSIKETIEGAYIRYVATTGDDSTGDGSSINPFKTISKAVASGAETVIVAGGDYNENVLDLRKALHDKVTIKGVRGEKVIFRRDDSLLLDDGSETLVSGYSNVYEAVISTAPGYNGAAQWLFFDGLNDAASAITTEEAHPLERGQFYRNNCTKLEKTTSDTLEAALAEIEAAETFKWWYDSLTQKLYFNRSEATSTYPIYRSSSSYLRTRENQSVVISNIEFRYGILNLEKLNVAELYNVASKCVYGAGCFMYNDSISVLFDHCEAALAFSGSNGDGFNGHATAGANPLAKYCQVTIRECWSHDNNDDGYSDHEYAEATIDGGLFEWNKKGGVTPSFGSHCVCKNVLSRHNYSGFYYGGTATEGNAGQMICYNCMSVSNNRSGVSNVGGFRIDGTNNNAVLVNCKSIGDRNAFSCGDTCTMTLYDCGYRNQVIAIYVGSGTFSKIKTQIAE
jgi:hypothetical protein